jgi:hypothetical protein
MLCEETRAIYHKNYAGQIVNLGEKAEYLVLSWHCTLSRFDLKGESESPVHCGTMIVLLDAEKVSVWELSLFTRLSYLRLIFCGVFK